MKHLGFILLLLFIVIMSSCTREYICQCKVSWSSATPGMPDTIIQEYLIKNTKKGAKNKCTQNSNSTTANGITITETCVLY